MSEILRLLPKQYLDEINIDSLLANGKYYPPGNDDEMTVRYSLEALNDSTGTLRVEMSFETGQRGFVTTELKRLKVKSKKIIVVYSKFNGTPFVFNQGELITYNLTKGKLIETKQNMLPTNLSISDFVKPNTPDSILKKYVEYSNQSYQLIYNGNNIAYTLYESFDYYGIDKSWLFGNKIEFIFEKGKFKRLPPSFEQE